MSENVWFRRGIYGSKDVPIRLLDGFIVLMIVVIISMVVYFSINGGYSIEFDTDGGSKVDSFKLRYGELIIEPKAPLKPGYEFAYWYVEEEPFVAWDFSKNEVEKELTLYSHWTQAKVLVKFDIGIEEKNDSKKVIEPKQVIFNETYGELPIPTRTDSIFLGWEYSGVMIEADTVVWMTGEHVLNAVWK